MELTPFFFGLYKFVKYGLYPLTWVVLLMAITTFILLFSPNPGRIRWARIGSISSLVLLLFISNPIVAGQLIGRLEAWYPPPPATPTHPYDAIVVLGGGVLNQGTLRPKIELTSYSRNRTICGVNLYEQDYAPRLLLTGGDASIFGVGPKEAVEMQRWAERLGVPPSAIMIDESARTTYENATGSTRLLGKSSIVLVSSASHLLRAAALFRNQGFQVTPAPCDYVSRDRADDAFNHLDPFDFLPSDMAIQHTREAVVEIAGFILYRLTGQL